MVGDPAYYARFGFSAEKASLIDCEYAGPYMMALEFVPGCLSSGAVFKECARVFMALRSTDAKTYYSDKYKLRR